MEMDLIRDYFVHLSQLDPILASRCANREFQLPALSAILIKFCSAEEAYTSLEFLKRKRFRSDTYLNTLYGYIQDDIRKELNASEGTNTKINQASLGMGNYISKRSQPSQIYEPILELIVLRKLISFKGNYY
ncbi:hypothetical protein DSO57_1021124 [Entomophthora muscae]|uniref:Uncharacterized protein n=1 Tax=Entomophthora muscae TaxID=34485 RepID=A0ACC2RI33_9FUNG|nr:hypothetical protein DSO57_1021124 [Entomophthora muscae]